MSVVVDTPGKLDTQDRSASADRPVPLVEAPKAAAALAVVAVAVAAKAAYPSNPHCLAGKSKYYSATQTSASVDETEERRGHYAAYVVAAEEAALVVVVEGFAAVVDGTHRSVAGFVFGIAVALVLGPVHRQIVLVGTSDDYRRVIRSLLLIVLAAARC